jgi:hypothetical protein
VSFKDCFLLDIKRGAVVKNRPITKTEQQKTFLENKVPCPHSEEFRLGMFLDKELYGDFVILKPADLTKTSHGENIFLYKRDVLQGMDAEEFKISCSGMSPEEFIVQRYVHTGKSPHCIRVGTFMGKAILSYDIKVRKKNFCMETDGAEYVVASNSGERDRRLFFDENVIKLAERVHSAFPSVPLLGTDIIKDCETGEYFVLEVNAGGNTWTFSSKFHEETQESLGKHYDPESHEAAKLGGTILKNQFGAFNIVARELVRAARLMAE